MPVKITVTLADGSTQDYVVAPPAPTQTVEVTAGQTVEIKAV